MQNALVTLHENAVTARQFDASILAGTKSPGTIDQYRMHFEAYLRFAGTFDAAMTPTTLALWRQALYEEGYTTPTGKPRQYSVNAINQRLAAIRAMMEEAAQQGYISYEAAFSFKRVKGFKQLASKGRRNVNARTPISRADMKRILEAPDTSTLAGKMHHALLAFLAGTGVRISEAVDLRRSQIHWGEDDEGNQGWCVDIAGKNKTDATQRALATFAKLAIDDWLSARSAAGVESEYVFTSFAGRGDRNPSTAHMNRVSAWAMVQRYTERCGLSHVKPHDFRRFVGTALAKKDIRLAQKQLGHANIATTAKHYVLDTARVGATDDLVS